MPTFTITNFDFNPNDVNYVYYTYTSTISTGANIDLSYIEQTQAWQGWANTSAAIQNTAYNSAAWYTWTVTMPELEWNRRAQRTEEELQLEREAFNQRLQEQQRITALAQAERIVADKLATELLFEHLTEHQQKTWTENRMFAKEINGKTYEFHTGTHGNVYRVDNGEKVERFCIAPISPDRERGGGMLPVPDVVLAQMLFLEADEIDFRRIANVTDLTKYRTRAAAAAPVQQLQGVA
jgi:hypothetical protein